MHGEFAEMVLYHSILIKAMLAVFVVGSIIPFLSSECAKTVKRMRIYMFVAHGTLTMIAFSGVIAFVFADLPFTLSIITMIVMFFAMIMIEVVKYKKILKNQNAENCVKSGRMTAVMFTLVNIAMLAAMVVWKIMEAKSAVSVS